MKVLKGVQGFEAAAGLEGEVEDNEAACQSAFYKAGWIQGAVFGVGETFQGQTETGNTMHLNSDSAINVDGCSIQVNSSTSDALTTNSSSTVDADSTCVTGDYQGSGYTPTPITGWAPVADPLADLAPPTFSTPPCTTDKVVNSASETLDPGVYCGKLEINSGSTAILNPGVYILDDATFIANSNSTIIGTDVTIYLTGSDGYRRCLANSFVKRWSTR